MSVRDFMIQIIIALVGIAATFLSVVLSTKWQKILFGVVAFILFIATAGLVGIEYGRFSSGIQTNRLDVHYEFESIDEGWSELTSQKMDKMEFDTIVKQYPQDTDFPGQMSKEITKDKSLTGSSSLRVTITHNETGTYKSYLRRQGTVNGHSITIYVLAPELEGVTIHYIQVCATVGNWYCSRGTRLIPGEWTPITVDLDQTDENKVALSRQQLPGLAVQWRYSMDKPTSYNLYFDAFEIKHSGT